MFQEAERSKEPALEEMTEEDIQIRIIKKKKEKKEIGTKFIGDLKQRIYDAINK